MLCFISRMISRDFSCKVGGEGADDRKLLSTKTAKNDIKKLIKDKLKQCDRLKDVKRSIKSSRTKKNYGAV